MRIMKFTIFGIGLGLVLALSAEETKEPGNVIALTPADQQTFERLLQAMRTIENELDKLRLRACIGKVAKAEECGNFDQQGKITIVKEKPNATNAK